MRSSDAAYAKQLRDAIATVHDVQGIANLAIEREPLPQGWNGQFDPYTRIVTVSPEAVLPLCTGVHEIGHAVDALYLVEAGKLGRLDGPITLYASQYAAQERGVLVDWYQHIIKTKPIVEIAHLARDSGFMSAEWEELQYILAPAEMWARSYEQFIAQNTKDAELQAQFNKRRLEGERIGSKEVEVYWTTEEFSMVEREIRRALASLGWLS